MKLTQQNGEVGQRSKGQSYTPRSLKIRLLPYKGRREPKSCTAMLWPVCVAREEEGLGGLRDPHSSGLVFPSYHSGLHLLQNNFTLSLEKKGRLVEMPRSSLHALCSSLNL